MTLEPHERDLLKKLMAYPLDLPDEFRSWGREYFGSTTPSSTSAPFFDQTLSSPDGFDIALPTSAKYVRILVLGRSVFDDTSESAYIATDPIGLGSAWFDLMGVEVHGGIDGSSVALVGVVPGASKTSGVFGSAIIDVPFIDVAGAQTMIASGGNVDSSGGGGAELAYARWDVKTPPITSIGLFTRPLASGTAYNFDTGSRAIAFRVI